MGLMGTCFLGLNVPKFHFFSLCPCFFTSILVAQMLYFLEGMCRQVEECYVTYQGFVADEICDTFTHGNTTLCTTPHFFPSFLLPSLSMFCRWQSHETEKIAYRKLLFTEKSIVIYQYLILFTWSMSNHPLE